MQFYTHLEVLYVTFLKHHFIIRGSLVIIGWWLINETMVEMIDSLFWYFSVRVSQNKDFISHNPSCGLVSSALLKRINMLETFLPPLAHTPLHHLSEWEYLTALAVFALRMKRSRRFPSKSMPVAHNVNRSVEAASSANHPSSGLVVNYTNVWK